MVIILCRLFKRGVGVLTCQVSTSSGTVHSRGVSILWRLLDMNLIHVNSPVYVVQTTTLSLGVSHRFWNTTTGCALEKIDTGSQVCNLSWSRNVNEIVSTHGYSQNQVVVWKYPTMTKLATLTGRRGVDVWTLNCT